MADVSDVVDLLRNSPKITRWWLSLSVIFPLLVGFRLLDGYWLIMMFEPVVYRFQIWRLLTGFFVFPSTYATGYLLSLYLIYSYSWSLESDMFSRQRAEYLSLLMFCGVIIIIFSLLLDLQLLMVSLTMSAVYVWCNQNKDTVIWFGIPCKHLCCSHRLSFPITTAVPQR